MTTKNTVSIPGIQASLLEEVKNTRDRQAEERERQNQEKEILESKRIAESKQAFLDYLDKYAGAILRQLDFSTWTPVIENSAGSLDRGFTISGLPTRQSRLLHQKIFTVVIAI